VNGGGVIFGAGYREGDFELPRYVRVRRDDRLRLYEYRFAGEDDPVLRLSEEFRRSPDWQAIQRLALHHAGWRRARRLPPAPQGQQSP
jgi:hypothetical protein